MELKRILLLTCLVLVFSNINALNLTNNTSWESVRYVYEDGEVYIHRKKDGKLVLLDINESLLSRVVNIYDENGEIIDTDIATSDITSYKNVKNTHVINDDSLFYYNEDKQELILQLDDDSELVFKQVK